MNENGNGWGLLICVGLMITAVTGGIVYMSFVYLKSESPGLSALIMMSVVLLAFGVFAYQSFKRGNRPIAVLGAPDVGKSRICYGLETGELPTRKPKTLVPRMKIADRTGDWAEQTYRLWSQAVEEAGFVLYVFRTDLIHGDKDYQERVREDLGRISKMNIQGDFFLVGTFTDHDPNHLEDVYSYRAQLLKHPILADFVDVITDRKIKVELITGSMKDDDSAGTFYAELITSILLPFR